MPIYYVYLKADGSYQGNGTPYFDDELYGCTEIPFPIEAGENYAAWKWDNATWSWVSTI